MDVVLLNPDQREAYCGPHCQAIVELRAGAPKNDLAKLRSEHLEKLQALAERKLGPRRLQMYQTRLWMAILNAFYNHSMHAAQSEHLVHAAYQAALVYLDQWIVDHPA